MQLLHQYSPIAALMLGVMVPIFEPLGLQSRGPGTLLGYEYSLPAIVAILISSLLGLLVSLSTFLVIGATSSLTYNVVGATPSSEHLGLSYGMDKQKSTGLHVTRGGNM